MTIRTLLVSLSVTLGALFAAAGCEINNCEQGANCSDWGDEGDLHKKECVSYCGRLSVCGASQAKDFEECVDSCRDRYQRLPDETHRLCSCAEESACSDVVEGRCSQPNGSGGSCNACGNGGSSTGNGGATTGSGGASTGNGGASTANGGASTGSGATTGTGGASSGSGGTSSGSGGDAGISCEAACDCPANYNCVSGRCTPI